MKAMVMEKLGAANLALRDVPDPKSGAGEVLVRMRAASLNFRDLLVLDGKYGSMQKRENLILLSDGAGEIAEVGAGVTEWKVGDRVVGCFFPHWQDGAADENALRGALGGQVGRRRVRVPRVRPRRNSRHSTESRVLSRPRPCLVPR